MQDALENTSNTTSVPQQSGLISTIFREYRNHFGLFWRVMLPLIIASLILYIGWFLFFKQMNPEAQWTFSTSAGVNSLISAGSSETLQPVSESSGVKTYVGFHGSAFDIGFLWLAMCPFAFIIVHQHRGVAITFGETWQQTRRKVVPILGVYILLWLLSTGAGVVFASLVLRRLSVGLAVTMFLILSLVNLAMFHFLVKWSLSNQCVIIENLSVVAALRRSSQLVRGTWGRFFGMYLLLVLVTMVFTTAILGLTLLLLSVSAPEFVPLREVLLSGKFFSIFLGGHVQITLQDGPTWAIVVMLVVSILIDAVFAPVWALLTTHLYMERAGTVLKGTVELESVPQAVSG